VINFIELDREHEAAELVAFLTANRFPFHVRASWSDQQARKAVEDDVFWSDGRQAS